jgi:predicted DNA-binding antitoxin AbrB/MazE fold protein
MRGGFKMATVVKALYTNGTFKPLEDLDFREGEQVTLTIEKPATPPKKGIAASAGAWKDTIDCEQLKKDIYASRLIRTRPEVKL